MIRDKASRKRVSRRQAGDTIVEVILAVAIVSMVLAGAFAVTSRSSKDIRVSEEHAQALQYLQGQVELLRSAAGRSSYLSTNPWLVSGFCLDSSNFYQDTSATCQTTGGVSYALSIKKNPAGAGPTTTFDLQATWASLNGGNDRVNLSYRIEVAP